MLPTSCWRRRGGAIMPGSFHLSGVAALFRLVVSTRKHLGVKESPFSISTAELVLFFFRVHPLRLF